MSRARRYSLVLLSALLLAVCLVLLVARSFLASERVASEVRDRLATLLNAPVSLGRAEIGADKIRVRDFHVYEDDAEQQTPWLTVEEAEGRATPFGLVTGRSLPKELMLRGASLVLRFDRQGQLLTRLPKVQDGSGELPRLLISGGTLTVQQEGRPEFAIHKLRVSLESDKGQFALEGQFDDPAWGLCDVSGFWTPVEHKANLTLKSARKVHITSAMLHSLPFVSPRVWDEVHVDGISPVEVDFKLGSEEEKLHYDARFAPEATTVRITALDFDAQQVQGKLRIVDEVVTFKGSGRAAHGEINVDTRLDFQATPSRLEFRLQAQQLDLEALPADWGLPHQLKGRLSGKADLTVFLEEKGPRTTGQGEGLITDAKLGDIPVAEPIRLSLHPEGSRYRFLTPKSPPGGGAALSPALTLALIAQAEAVEGHFLPAEGVNWLQRGLRGLVQTVIQQGGNALAQLPPASQKPAPPKPADSLLEANLRLDEVEVEQLARTAGMTLPLAAKGRVSVAVRVGIPLNNSRELKAYRLEGTAESKRLDLAGLELEQIEARFRYRDGSLQLEELRARMPGEGEDPPGSLSGTAAVGMIPLGELSTRLVIREVPLSRLAKLLSLPPGHFAGGLSGAVSLRAPVERLKEADAWEGAGLLAAENLRAYGWSVHRMTGVARLRDGTFALPQVTADLEGTRVTGSADLKLDGDYPYRAHLRVRQADLTALRRLAPEVRPPLPAKGQLDAEATVQGTLRPLRYQARGNATSIQLKLADFKASTARLNWEIDGDLLRIKALQATLYQGEVTGTARVPLRDNATGEVSIRFKDVAAGELSKDVGALPFHVEGRASGMLTASIPPPADGDRAWTAKMEVQAPRLRVQGIPTERLQATAGYRKGIIDYRMEGETLGGRFELDGKFSVAPAKSGPTSEGRLRLEGAQLGRLARALRMPALEPLHGRIDLAVTLQPQEPGRPQTGTGRFVLSRLRWGDVELTSQLSSPVQVTQNELRFNDLSGVFEEGLVRGRLALNFRQPERSRFTADLDRVEASRLLAPWPNAAAVLQGPIEARVSGSLGSEWSGSAEIALARGKLLGMEITEWRLPLSWAFIPAAARAQIEVRESSAQIARGRAQARASLGLGVGSRMEGQVRFFNVDLQTALRQSAELAAAGSGQLSGRLDFSGQDVRSLEDLSAVLDATLAQNQALELPVLQQVSPFILPGQSAATRFSSGHLQARLARGLIRVQRLTLDGDAGRVWVDGTVTPQGRLNLEVVAATSQLGARPVVLRRLGLRIPATGPIPLAVLLEARSYLANRAVYLHVTGTYRSPTIQVEPLSLLADEALRYFLSRSGLPIP